MKALPWVICAAILLVAASPKNNCREKAINDTLNLVLVVGYDMRSRGLHPRWSDIDAEVARRMRVKRTISVE